jgi:tetratricopeptide (TPR) repeat protein
MTVYRRSYSESTTVTCPDCGQAFPIEVWFIVDSTERPDLVERIQRGTIHILTCPHCSHQIGFDAPLLVHDAERQRVIYAPPQGTSEEQAHQIAAQLVGQLAETFAEPLPTYLQQVQAVPAVLLGAALNADDPEQLHMTPRKREAELAERLIEWVQTPTWADSRAFLEAHPKLLTEEAEKVLDHLCTIQEDEGARRSLEEHLTLLRQSRAEGPAAAFAGRIGDEESSRDSTLGDVPTDVASILRELGRPAHPGNIPRRIELCQQALGLVERGQDPALWAAVQIIMADSLLQTPGGDRADNLERAIEHYTLALEVRTRQAFPTEWAATQNDLGAAYWDRIRGERADNLERAIEHYTLALEVRTRQADPAEWAMTQNNLANAYYVRIRGERADNLERTIEHYNQAVQVRTH